MAEYIDREAVIDLLHYHADEACSALVADFEAIPAADVVEVVRCKECKYHRIPACPMRLSFNWTNDYDFCSYGERKGGEE